MGKCPQTQAMHRTELSASNPAVGEERAQAWRGEPRHGPGAQAAPARRLGQPWSAGTRLRTSTQPDASTRQHQAPPWGHRRHVATNGGCCCLSIAGDDVSRIQLASTSQKMATNSTASPHQHPRSPRRGCSSSPGCTASTQPLSTAPALPAGFGELAEQPLWAEHPLPGSSPSWGYLFAGNPFLWSVISDAARDISVPLGQKYIPALFQSKMYLQLRP